MKITYNWLREYVDFQFSPDELVKQLTMLGLEVDSHRAEFFDFTGIIVGEVLEKKKHPNADRLSVCQVNLGSQTAQIVCGAPNVDAGQKVAVATAGTRLPGGLKIKKTVIRDVESNGMICSGTELQLTSDSDGILVLDSALKAGAPLSEVVAADDHLIDIDVTPNRPDCFGVMGIARDVAALTKKHLEIPATSFSEDSTTVDSKIKIQIHDSEKCPRYAARYIKNVEIKQSPFWLVRRLEQLGVRAINNVVDITNFVMMETGRPLHAFDYDLLQGGEIHVRCAEKGEKFTTLDNKTHALNAEALLICDKSKPVALAGIMGGLNSEVSEETTNVLLESAYFDPVNVRRTCKALSISTESSKRFERGVDPNSVNYALDRAAQLIAELSGGEIARGIADEYPNPQKPIQLTLRPSRVQLLLGVEIAAEVIQSILENLGFEVKPGEVLKVTVPTFRPDVTREADLVEEVGRVYGFDNIPADTSAMVEQSVSGSEQGVFESQIKRLLVSLGFSEVATYNLISPKSAKIFSPEAGHVDLLNPLSEDLATLRPTLIASLLQSARWNLNRSCKNLKLFEIGSVFSLSQDDKAQEDQRFAGLLSGERSRPNWRDKSRNVDFFDVKGVVEELLSRAKVPAVRFQKHISEIFALNTLAVYSDKTLLGYIGELTDEVRAAFDIEQSVFCFDLDFSAMQSSRQEKFSYSPIPKFPSVHRDLAVLISEEVSAEDILKEVKSTAGPLLNKLEIFDVFRGEQVGDGRKSLALSFLFLSPKRTLKEREIDKLMDAVLKNLNVKFSAQLRP